MMRAVIYLRVSSYRQVGPDHKSLETQERACRSFCEAEGFDLLEVIVDPAKSGKDVDRPEYLRLLGMARERKVDVVVIYSVSRFGREKTEYFIAQRRFKAFKVPLLSATEPNNSGFLRDMQILLADLELEIIRDRVVPNQKAKLEDGKWVGTAPWGYDVVPHPTGGKTLRPNADAVTVRCLFCDFATGEYSLRTLGKKYGMRANRLSGLLRNPAYTGKSIYGRSSREADEDGHLSRARRPRELWDVYDGLHEALVSQEDFNLVQAILDRNKVQGDPQAHNRQLLVGLGYCACGARLVSNRHRGYPRYMCCKRSELGASGCEQPSVSGAKVDPVVKAMVSHALRGYRDKTMWAGALAEMERLREASVDTQQAERRRLEADRTRLSNRLNNAAALLSDGVMSPEVYRVNQRDWTSLLANIENELRDLPQAPVVPDYEAQLRQMAVANIDWDVLTDDRNPGAQELWRVAVAETVERVTITGGVPDIELKPLAKAFNAEAERAREALIRI